MLMLTGKRVTLNADSSQTVEDVKTMVHEREGIPPGQQILVFASYELDDSW